MSNPYALADLHRDFNGLCVWCGRPTTLDGPVSAPLKATREHLLPVAHGGGGGRYNLALACFRCNNGRAESKDPPPWTEPADHLRSLSRAHDTAWRKLLGEPQEKAARPERNLARCHLPHGGRRVIASMGPNDRPGPPKRRRVFDFAAGW